jgi:hypothetical protein
MELVNMYTGPLHVTRGIQTLIDDNKLQYEELWQIVNRHINMDYGDVEDDSVEINNKAIDHSFGTVLSSYTLHNIKIWVCTTLTKEIEDVHTVIMLPSEY